MLLPHLPQLVGCAAFTRGNCNADMKSALAVILSNHRLAEIQQEHIYIYKHIVKSRELKRLTRCLTHKLDKSISARPG